MNYTEVANKLLSEKGIRPSYIRINVLAYLLEHASHPTADGIYQELHKTIFTLSKTSVYNTLALLIELKLVRAITIDEKEVRYDGNVAEHGHFQCLKCKGVYDFSVIPGNEAVQGLNGFQVEERNYYYYGLCPKCQSHKLEEENNEKFNRN